MARPKGFEPLTPRFVVWCSIQLSYGRAGRGHPRGAARGPRHRGVERLAQALRSTGEEQHQQHGQSEEHHSENGSADDVIGAAAPDGIGAAAALFDEKLLPVLHGGDGAAFGDEGKINY